MSEDRASRNQVFGSAAMAQDGIPARDVMKDDFGWEVPVESVPVPSGGKIYAPSTNLHGVSTIDIKAMTAQEEDILTSRALIRKGIVLSKLIESCVIDKNIDTRHMVAGDRNALMIAIRVTGYGSEYKTDITCPSCSHRQPYEFDLGELAIVPLEIDPVTPGENRFSYTLPVTKKKVEFKFLTGVDEEEMTAEAEKMRQIMPDREITNNVTRNLEKSILSIDGVTDRVKITLFIKQMPARDSRMLRQYMERNEPGIDMTTTMGCSNCGTSSSVQLPLGTGFFWPRD